MFGSSWLTLGRKVGGCDNYLGTARPLKQGESRVASDIQSSSQWNSGGRRLVLKTLFLMNELGCGMRDLGL